MRFKNRYIICKLVINDVHTMDLLTEADIVTAVRKSVELHFGIYSIGKYGASMGVEKYDKASGTFILRCYQSGIRDVLASLLYLDTVRNSPSIIRVMGVNSTQERALMSFNQIINQNKQMETLP